MYIIQYNNRSKRKLKMSTLYRSRTIGNDKLVLEKTNGYYPDPDQTVYRVMYCEYVGKDSAGRSEFNTMNMELFTCEETADIAFNNRRKSNDPTKESGIIDNLLQKESLGDILQGAIG